MCRANVQAQPTACRSEAEASGGYPIEIAPRDGTQVLCGWITKMRDGRLDVCSTVHVLEWHADWLENGEGAWVMDGDWLTHFVPDGIYETPPLAYGNPTHWSPIPPLPQPNAGVKARTRRRRGRRLEQLVGPHQRGPMMLRTQVLGALHWLDRNQQSQACLYRTL